MDEDSIRITSLLMRMQQAFLDGPALRLTVAAARQRFGADDLTCGAVLDALADAGVLARTPDGAFVRFFPRPAGGRQTFSVDAA